MNCVYRVPALEPIIGRWAVPDVDQPARLPRRCPAYSREAECPLFGCAGRHEGVSGSPSRTLRSPTGSRSLRCEESGGPVPDRSWGRTAGGPIPQYSRFAFRRNPPPLPPPGSVEGGAPPPEGGRGLIGVGRVRVGPGRHSCTQVSHQRGGSHPPDSLRSLRLHFSVKDPCI